jgi:mono/diheme cytochrome c family protein
MTFWTPSGRFALVFLALALAAGVGAGARGEQPPSGAPRPASSFAGSQAASAATIDAGRALFATHCASCHGPNGRGGGPVAPELRHEVPDLTRFAMRNGGMFPSVRVQRIIDGTEVPTHGTREMPVWGDVFKRMRGASDAEVQRRIEAITRFLESIQERAG